MNIDVRNPNMKIGNRVKVTATDTVWGVWNGAIGTITDERISVWGIHKFIVTFDKPIKLENNPLMIGFDFPDSCLEII